MKQSKLLTILALSAFTPWAAFSAMQQYKIDPDHSTVTFQASHLGISMMPGTIPGVEGTFAFDPNDPTQCEVEAVVHMKSIDTDHAERDKHLKGKDFLKVPEHPKATFVSTQCEGNQQTGTLHGDLQFMGKTQPIKIKVDKTGEGDDPWGGYRAGFKGTFELNRKDFGIDYQLGPNTDIIEITIYLEGIKN